MLEIIAKGGPIMYLLILCSMVGLYVVINKIIYLKVNFQDTQHLFDCIKTQLITHGKEKTSQKLRTNRTVIGKTLCASIKLSQCSKTDIQDEIDSMIQTEATKLDRFMPILTSIISVAPILGLTGTVLGLMDIFNVISGGGLGDPELLSSGIAEALITTVTGLIIVVPFIFANQFLTQQIDQTILTIQTVAKDTISFCQTNSAVKL